MTLRVHNTLTRTKEEFKPLTGKRVSMFVCGITPYDSPHIGHAKTYVAFDVIAKYLRHKGYSVFYLQNVTDIDDHIIARANETGRDWRDIVEEFFTEYMTMMRALRVDSINLYARATDYMDEIIEQIKALEKGGFAYPVDGDVFFSVDRFNGWGKLSGQRTEEHLPGARVEVDERKRNPADFALWKSQKPGEPSWPSPWGPGRPGWHIEDTAITITRFGPQYDIHGGATELMFPHHEAEVAQAESFTGVEPFVKYWIHTGLLMVNKEKMSKSLGNFWTIRDALSKFPAPVVRFYLLHAHYRSPIEFTLERLEEAERSYKTIVEAVGRLRQALREGVDVQGKEELTKAAEEARVKFEESMDDDFNTREAIGAIFEFAREVNKALDAGASAESLRTASKAFDEFSEILGLFEESPTQVGDLVPKLLDLLGEMRAELRSRKQYDVSDKIRQKLADLGIVMEDEGGKQRWKIK